MKKRLFSGLLAFCLTLTMLPTAAMAAKVGGAEQEQPSVCTCEEACAEGALAADCGKYEAPELQKQPDEPTAAETVQALLDALPELDALVQLNDEEQLAVYDAAGEAYDALEALLELDPDAAAALVGVERLTSLLDYFNGSIETIENNDFEVLKDKLSSSDTVTLDRDYSIGQTLDIKKTVTLDLNGHVLRYTGSGDFIKVGEGGELTITDSKFGSTDAAHKFKVESDGLWTLDEANGTETVYGGVITNGAGCGLVVLERGKVTMKGGNIVGCKASDHGGVYISSKATFIMDDGRIAGCAEECTGDGVGVQVEGQGSSFTMNGGSIDHCYGYSCGGVRVFAGSFIMNGGTITDCYASGSSYGGCAVYGSFMMTGGTINDCGKDSCSHSREVTASSLSTYGGTINAGVSIDSLTEVDTSSSLFKPGKATVFNGKVTNNGSIGYGIFYGGLTHVDGGKLADGSCVVTYKSFGNDYAVAVVPSGSTAIKPIDPIVPSGWRFGGWKLNDDDFDFNSALIESITLIGGVHVAHDGGEATCKAQRECDICGEFYGSIDPTNHSGITYIPAKSPSTTEYGNIEYWYCSGCGKCYSDEALTSEITLEETLLERSFVIPIGTLDYRVEASAGFGGTISPDGRTSVRHDSSVTFTITPDDGYEIEDVKLDGRSVGAVDSYTLEHVRENHTLSVTFARLENSAQGGTNVEVKPPFADVSESDWFYEDVSYVWANGLMNGVEQLMFASHGTMTRGMLVTILYRLAGEPAMVGECAFTDVAEGAYYEKAVI